ncbi:unnamed protein product [Eruca vesicaria subsp. sativa]|uniref:Uncharacterized protein n=1 Tax=Eruca vesicaria subsp. sativa TaxID=29727 RepID=A0ABC8JWC4_ERUVS|nr:unnamed protein product [Eruca vesicaria subsp. sativa]
MSLYVPIARRWLVDSEKNMSFMVFNVKSQVSPCSHIGGHKYAGNVIIYQSKVHRKVTGHWYGYVQPEDVPVLLEQHINKGEIVDRLWRSLEVRWVYQKNIRRKLKNDGEVLQNLMVVANKMGTAPRVVKKQHQCCCLWRPLKIINLRVKTALRILHRENKLQKRHSSE